MFPSDLQDWLEGHSGQDFTWFAKRLSGNDTLANRSHQAGPYIPKDLLFRMFPQLNRPEAENPHVWFDLHVDSHPDSRRVKAIWYNNRWRGGTRNETRIPTGAARSRRCSIRKALGPCACSPSGSTMTVRRQPAMCGFAGTRPRRISSRARSARSSRGDG